MNDALDIRIDGTRVTSAQVEDWEARRARVVLPKLRRMLKREASARPLPNDLASLRAELLRLKEECGRQGLREGLSGGIGITGFVSKLTGFFSGGRRKQCVTEVRVPRCSAKQIFDTIDDLMRNDTQVNRQSNLLACPDHYVLEPRGDTLEVIETTGGSPFPARFFMRFDDESGVRTPRDPAFPYQSVGTARLADGTVVGGVRHQMRDDGGGALVRLMVEFPSAVPQHMIREHQWHLACEFSHWLREAMKAVERAT
ncbi:hypothetical protein J2W25_002247 [Variovorax boronicumulans]|uniref:Uncharacterized protein n=1 Tax=Variovorax boronicumulans TaxID=436515 RepID=A0AAW8DUU0_9BURK|nr:hypothetical protein [Variovorax boronicumulans]MDP9877942.1 hypothetical protein [Variovorax boronicumulans]MDP9923226.1 hypothetical protein [Variovorax boronicumulans]